MRKASGRGTTLGLSEDEPTFYDALETNDHGVKVRGNETLRDITRGCAVGRARRDQVLGARRIARLADGRWPIIVDLGTIRNFI